MDQGGIDRLMKRIKSGKGSSSEVFSSIANKFVKEHSIPRSNHTKPLATSLMFLNWR